MSSLGIYVSVPFCRAKCSFCNFASGVFAAGQMDGYVARVGDEIGQARVFAAQLGAELPASVDSIYLGGGTPSLLDRRHVSLLFTLLQDTFAVEAQAEITVECAPGQVSEETLQALLEVGVNRLSFGVQSFVDAECTVVGRLHTGAGCRAELRRTQAAGVTRLGVDLIVGLPMQTFESWRYTVDQVIDSGVEHVSVYMLEVDDGSRLGREVLRGGARYGARALPEGDRVADWYAAGCEWLAAAGVRQYEISNFARAGGESRHNRKYWERKGYIGFGMDAHSMLTVGDEAVRWANAGEMEAYVGRMGERGFRRTVERLDRTAGFEEAVFLGLRLVEGVDLDGLRVAFGVVAVDTMLEGAWLCVEAGLLKVAGGRMWLTERGRMASNEVFERLLVGELVV